MDMSETIILVLIKSMFVAEVGKIFFFLSSRSIGTIFSAKFKKFEVRVMHIHLKKSNDLGFNQNILLQKRQYFPDFVC